MCRVISELDKHTKHVLVHTGQNYDYELNEVFFDELEIRKTRPLSWSRWQNSRSKHISNHSKATK